MWIPLPKPVDAAPSSTKAIGRLSDIDHQILALMGQHRVLTTSLIIQLIGRPERTVDYRLLRLYKLGLLGRTRPYVDKGTAPFFWWLAAAGARLTNGTSPVTSKRTPNPLFLAHATANAALWAALVANGPEVGLEPTTWLREEAGWEEFDDGGLVRSIRKMRPDARVEARLRSGEPVRAFIEIDMGTMDQGRLATKVTRFLDYHASKAWVDRHKHCPGLLLLTTSDARARTFIERAGKTIKSKHSVYSKSQPAMVAACGLVRDPMSAVTERSWQIAGDPELVTLREVFNAIDVRRSEYYELIHQEEQQILQQQFSRAINDIESWAKTSKIEDDSHLIVAMWLYGTDNRYEWAHKHQPLIWQTAEWIGSTKKGNSTTAPERLRSQWQELHAETYRQQVKTVLADKDAIERQDPRLVAAVSKLLNGFLISDLNFNISNPVDAIDVRIKERQEYEQQRHAAVGQRITSLTWRERRKGLEQRILDHYDRENLVVCSTCGIERHRDTHTWLHCQYCSGKYVSAHEYEPLPPLSELLDLVARMAGFA